MFERNFSQHGIGRERGGPEYGAAGSEMDALRGAEGSEGGGGGEGATGRELAVSSAISFRGAVSLRAADGAGGERYSPPPPPPAHLQVNSCLQQSPLRGAASDTLSARASAPLSNAGTGPHVVLTPTPPPKAPLR